MSLSVRGLLAPEDDDGGFEPTIDEREDVELRPYEDDLLDAIEGDDDERAMVNAVYNFDFFEFLEVSDLYESEEVDRSILFGLINWTATETSKTDAYDAVFNQLREMEESIRNSVESEKVPTGMVPFVYAFPNTDFHGEFAENVDKLTVDLDENDSDTAAMSVAANGAAAAVAASSAASCAAAASSCASSAAASCSASSAAGAGGAV